MKNKQILNNLTLQLNMPEQLGLTNEENYKQF